MFVGRGGLASLLAGGAGGEVELLAGGRGEDMSLADGGKEAFAGSGLAAKLGGRGGLLGFLSGSGGEGSEGGGGEGSEGAGREGSNGGGMFLGWKFGSGLSVGHGIGTSSLGVHVGAGVTVMVGQGRGTKSAFTVGSGLPVDVAQGISLSLSRACLLASSFCSMAAGMKARRAMDATEALKVTIPRCADFQVQG